MFEIGKDGAEPGQFVTGAAQSAGVGGLVVADPRFIQEECIDFADQMRHEEILRAVSIDVVHGHAHIGLCAARGIKRAAHWNRLIRKRAVFAIDPEIIRAEVVGDKDVGPAIGVDIIDGDAQTGTGGEGPRGGRRALIGRGQPVARFAFPRDSRRVTDVLEHDLSSSGRLLSRDVVVQLVRAATKRRGGTIIGLILVPEAPVRRNVIDVIGHIQIQPAVEVIVDEAGGAAPERIIDPGRNRNVQKRAVTLIEIQDVGAVVGHVQLWKPIVVRVSNGRAHAVTRIAHTGILGDIDKAAVCLLAKEPIGDRVRAGPLLTIKRIVAAHQIDIQVAILVIIQQRTSAEHAFGQEMSPFASRDMQKIHASLGGHFPQHGRDPRFAAHRLCGNFWRGFRRLLCAVAGRLRQYQERGEQPARPTRRWPDGARSCEVSSRKTPGIWLSRPPGNLLSHGVVRLRV